MCEWLHKDSGARCMSDVPWINYYMIVFGMMMEDPEWHRNWLSLQRGRTRDDVVNQLYAYGSVTGQTEMEMELTCNMEHNNHTNILIRTSEFCMHWGSSMGCWAWGLWWCWCFKIYWGSLWSVNVIVDDDCGADIWNCLTVKFLWFVNVLLWHQQCLIWLPRVYRCIGHV